LQRAGAPSAIGLLASRRQRNAMNLTNIALSLRSPVGGGGFVMGLIAGLAVFDDATNSDRKVWTTALLSAA